jgi:glyoxylase-like metal-dependent hydrolase (beta-lactamase superfamily II)
VANFDMHLGDVRVTRIEELVTPLFDPKFWFGDYDRAAFDAERDTLPAGFFDPATPMMIASIHSWVLRVNGKVILLDTCVGNHKNRASFPAYDMLDQPYLPRLKAAGVSPEDVDMVMCTHLHADHVGWNTKLENGSWVPAFPNARYLMSGVEHEWAAEQAADPKAAGVDINAYNDSVLPIVEAGRHIFVEGTETIAPGLSLRATPGHTPGHTGLVLDSRGKRAFFSGDALHFPQQVPLWHWPVVFDHDPAQSCESRRQILEHCAEHDALLLPTHFPAPFGCHVHHRAGKFGVDFSRVAAL